MVGVYVVTFILSRAYLEAEYDRTGSIGTAIDGSLGLAHLLVIVAIVVVVARKSDAGRTTALGAIVLGFASLMPVVTWGAYAAMVWFLTADGLDWPLHRRVDPTSGINPVAEPPSPNRSGAEASLAGRLAALEDARQRGLITAEEYARKRTAIVNDF